MRFFQKDLLITFIPAIVLVIAGFYVAWKFVGPAPPDRISISTGSQDGAYYDYALRYREILARNRIELEILTSAGSAENIANLADGRADIAFVQGGATPEETDAEFESLGSLFFEPVWVFYAGGETVDRLSGFDAHRIAAGAPGSGTEVLATRLLAENGVLKGSRLFPLGSTGSAEALVAEKIDVAIMVASPHSSAVQKLLDQRYIRLMNFSRAEAYARRYPYFSVVRMPQGVFNLEKNLPQRETSLIAATANLVINPDLHPALIYLLLQAADEVHSNPGLVQNRDQFPAPDYLVYPLSDVAARYYKSGLPFLQRYLPFWAAVLIDQLIVLLVPLFALLLPLIKLTPPLYQWRIRSRIFKWYKELRTVDRNLALARAGKFDIDELKADIERIEREVEKLEIPISYEDRHYNLRLHINLVNSELRTLESPDPDFGA